ncbi:peptidase S1 and S6, chymotrypsin/Hap [Paenibacillus mucilaginosus 3016]|uniref:Peptidase S1 and S6, chymotrypsin/Hap n=2 Tax=Paenibacillus mucilaginosus TaxID=61624 RepID=H6NIT6_9BACL|nr:trypsin-like peptidase domain-containing protein [Paenibacillus mucilaginosus]AFC33986.1 peptidase S1 and S6, chymotrypsin/Hap [Paenibacillus mucilaginosus 3016]AGN70848.1 peptidase S1 [Paenibacillus mucilaginosus K02]WFA22353.1 trypsin-like serine protease [Paenibacillus mucilaginosus]
MVDQRSIGLTRQRVCVRLLLVFLLTAVLLLPAGRWTVQAESAAVMDPRVLADTNKPGVVMIATLYKASISVPEVYMSQEALQGLQKKLAGDILSGAVANNPNAIIDALLLELFKDPLKYLVPTDTFTSREVQTGSVGTGFIVTPDGYIVTNAHVVYTPEETLKVALIETGLKELIDKDVTDFLNDVKANNYKPSEEILNGLRKAAAQFYVNYAQLSHVQTQIYTEMGVAIPGIQVMQKGFPSELKRRGEPTPGKDVAILKIDKTNLPTVTIGDDTGLRTGDKIYVVGYPGAATFNPMLATESVVESTLTSGLVSARKTMPGGWDILQVDAAMSGGNSGGPVFNESGEVIGIATFGSINTGSGTEVQGMNFAIPISIAKQFLNESNITPSESQLTKIYKEGLSLYNSRKYSKALEKFREVNELNPGYPYIQNFISESRLAINNNQDESGLSLTVILWIAGGVVVLALLIILILFVRRKYSFTVARKPADSPPPPSAEGQPPGSGPEAPGEPEASPGSRPKE